MEDNLIELLTTFGYDIYRQGSLAENEPYPATFFTYWNNGEYEQSAYDNDTKSVVYDFDVNVYSNDPDTVYDVLNAARTLLKQNGYITPDRGHDVISDHETHIGRGMNVQKVKY